MPLQSLAELVDQPKVQRAKVGEESCIDKCMVGVEVQGSGVGWGLRPVHG